MIDLCQFADKLSGISNDLRGKYKDFFTANRTQFKKELEQKVGKFYPLHKLSKEELLKIGEIVAVDGSSNRVGGAYPHYIEIFQGLAKSTKGMEVSLNNIYTPVLSETAEEEEQQQRLLASIEVETTLEYLRQYHPHIIMMDGGFIRYKINCPQMWKELKEQCEMEGTLLFGVIKDIKTNIIGSALNVSGMVFDREILYNVFDVGELFLIDNEVNKKYLESGEGFSSAFLRLSAFPGVVGLDILESQQDQIVSLSNLCYTLTPERSRGVPMWLDIVDKEVKITDEVIRTLLEEYLDRDIYERFFVSERDKRTL